MTENTTPENTAAAYDSMHYVGDEGPSSIYVVRLGGRDAFHVLVSHETGVLAVATLDRSKIALTKGVAEFETILGEDGVTKRVDPRSFRRYVMGRTATFLATLYVPGFTA
jgi:hypothetical protein